MLQLQCSMARLSGPFSFVGRWTVRRQFASWSATSIVIGRSWFLRLPSGLTGILPSFLRYLPLLTPEGSIWQKTSFFGTSWQTALTTTWCQTDNAGAGPGTAGTTGNTKFINNFGKFKESPMRSTVLIGATITCGFDAR